MREIIQADFSILGHSLAMPTLEQTLEMYSGPIAEETARVLDQVDAMDNGRSVDHHWIVSFTDNNHPDDYIVRQQTMIRVFEHFGLAEAYYNPDAYPELASFDSDDNGWCLTLSRLDGKGIFRIVFGSSSVNQPGEPRDRQTVFYDRKA